jgi:hypothetical protein
MVINEFMRSRKWKGVMVWQGIAATSKILQSEKFCGWWSEGRTRKFGHLATQKKLAVQKKRKGTKMRQARVFHQRNLVPRLKI